MGWTRRFHVTCDGCGRMWLDGALTKADAAKLAVDGGWSTSTHQTTGLGQHWCRTCQQPPEEAAA